MKPNADGVDLKSNELQTTVETRVFANHIWSPEEMWWPKSPSSRLGWAAQETEEQLTRCELQEAWMGLRWGLQVVAPLCGRGLHLRSVV